MPKKYKRLYLWFWIWQGFLRYNIKTTTPKIKVLVAELYQNQKLLFKRYHWENEKEAIVWNKIFANEISHKGFIFRVKAKEQEYRDNGGIDCGSGDMG